MGQESESLLYLELGSGQYANAFLWNSFIVTAAHVGNEPRTITVPADKETAPVSFRIIPSRDLAISYDTAFRKGFEHVASPHIGDEVKVVGHHGEGRPYFEIVARVIEILSDDRIVIERMSGKPFQLGMSGCPAFDSDGKLVGTLVREAGETAGEKVILEPATALTR